MEAADAAFALMLRDIDARFWAAVRREGVPLEAGL